MGRRVYFILAFVLCLSASVPTASASVADTTFVPSITDSLAAALDNAFAVDSSQIKVRDRGFDASRYRMLGRFKPVDQVKFKSEKFIDNTFISLKETTLKLASPDYTFGLMTGLSFGKWFHEDHAVRINASAGRWNDNFNGYDIWGSELTATYMFNVVSYLTGYHPEYYCNLSVVAGAGAAMVIYDGHAGVAATAHVGANVGMKLSKGVEFFVEPLVALYSNGMAVSRAGNWRSWMTAFNGSMGLNFNISRHDVDPAPKKWFMSLVGGTQIQNSANVYNKIGIKNAFGLHTSIGVGHRVVDYFAVRGSLSYSRHKWVQYDELFLFSDYYALRVEGMLDLISAFSKKEEHTIGLSLLFGPEIGYMYKDDYGVEYLHSVYYGLTGGIQLKFAVAKKVRVFLEPRMSLIPYHGVSHDKTNLNDFANYYDGLLNINLGIEFDL